jgi:hypothetical protein
MSAPKTIEVLIKQHYQKPRRSIGCRDKTNLTTSSALLEHSKSQEGCGSGSFEEMSCHAIRAKSILTARYEICRFASPGTSLRLE